METDSDGSRLAPACSFCSRDALASSPPPVLVPSTSASCAVTTAGGEGE